MVNVTHWTERSTRDFLYSIASDFIEQLQERMETLPMKQSELAKAANVTKGYVSKMFKNPGNLSLETIVKFARIVGMKVSIVGYVDITDPSNSRGPISADVFRKTWEDAERPADMWAFEKRGVAKTDSIRIDDLLTNLQWGRLVFERTNNAPLNRFTSGSVRPLQLKRIPGRKNTQRLLEVTNAGS